MNVAVIRRLFMGNNILSQLVTVHGIPKKMRTISYYERASCLTFYKSIATALRTPQFEMPQLKEGPMHIG